MNPKFLVAMFLLVSPAIAAAQVTEQWAARYRNTVSSEAFAAAIAIDPAGNVYVTGSDGIYFNYSYVTIAYGPAGNQLWLARYDSPYGSSRARAIVYDDVTGHVYVTGSSAGPGAYEVDYATVAYDAAYGTELWVVRYGDLGAKDSSSYPGALALDAAGNIYVTGGTNRNPGGGRTDYATVAYDSVGNQLWAARYFESSESTGHASAMAVDKVTGNVYVTGRSGPFIGPYIGPTLPWRTVLQVTSFGLPAIPCQMEAAPLTPLQSIAPPEVFMSRERAETPCPTLFRLMPLSHTMALQDRNSGWQVLEMLPKIAMPQELSQSIA